MNKNLLDYRDAKPMNSRLLPNNTIAGIGLYIFATLSILAFFRKKIFQNKEESSKSLKVQSANLLATFFGIFLVHEEFAPIWGNMRFWYSLAYLYLSVANITFFISSYFFKKIASNDGQKIDLSQFLNRKMRTQLPSSTAGERGGRKSKEEKERREKKERRERRVRRKREKRKKEDEKSIIRQAQEFLQRLEQ